MPTQPKAKTVGISSATVSAPYFAPTQALRDAGYVTTYFQGAAYAEDPNDENQGYLFQLQSVATGQGDIEDLRIHRLRVDGTDLTYVDTQTVLQGGHVQSCKVRISAAGNPYVWCGLERYDSSGKYLGIDVYRIRYRFGGQTLARSNPDVDRVYTGSGNAAVIGSPDWTIVIRRVSGDYDYFEFHSEKDLLSSAVQEASESGTRPKPKATIKMLRASSGDAYQSAYALNKYNDTSWKVYRVTGTDYVKVVDSSAPSAPLDMTSQVRKALAPEVNTEPEGAFAKDGLLNISVQSGPAETRRVSYFQLKW